MVYSGKPSKACERCRMRRLKCDFGRPQCRKCIRANLPCPGYRNEQDLLFRNQTEQVVQKHSANEATNASGDQHRAQVVEVRCMAVVSDPVVHDGKFIVDNATLNVAVTFLLKRYFHGSSFSWVEKLYSTKSYAPVFGDVVSATALAAYSHESRRVRLLIYARNIYSDALLQMRLAIEQGQSITDSIWGAVLLMSRFETLANDGTEWSITDNWLNHISGAFAIFQARGREGSLQSPMSFELKEQTIHNYNLYCVRTQIEPPASLIAAEKALTKEIRALRGQERRELRIAFNDITSAWGKYRRTEIRINEVSILERSRRSQMMLRGAQELDEKLIEYERRFSSDSSFERLPASRLPQKAEFCYFRTWFDVYHVYPNHFEARGWNSVRMLRMAVHEEIISHCKALCSHYAALGCAELNDRCQELQRMIAESREIIADYVIDVCASAPQFLDPESVHCTHAAACFLAWPLFVAGRVALHFQDAQKQFVKNTLRWFASELNIKSAGIAADYLPLVDYRDGSLHAAYMF